MKNISLIWTIVCKVIAGRVHRSLDPIPDMETLAGKVGLYSNIDPILLNPRTSFLLCGVGGPWQRAEQR